MRKLIIGALVLLAALIAFSAYKLFLVPPAPLVIAVEPGPDQPSVTAAEAGIDPASLDAALDYARRRNTHALLVARGGHVVFEHYEPGFSRGTLVRFDELTPVVTTLLLGTALNDRLILDIDLPLTRYLGAGADESRTVRSLLVEGNAELLGAVIEKAAKQPFRLLLVDRLWKPLGNGGLRFEGGAVSASCCLAARIGDWLRLGQLLARDGVFEANQYTPPGFARALLTQGWFMRADGSFATRGVAWAGAAGHQRMWVVPSLDLVILRLGNDPAAGEAWDEAMIPDAIVRGTSGWQPASGGEGTDPKKYAPH